MVCTPHSNPSATESSASTAVRSSVVRLVLSTWPARSRAAERSQPLRQLGVKEASGEARNSRAVSYEQLQPVATELPPTGTQSAGLLLPNRNPVLLTMVSSCTVVQHSAHPRFFPATPDFHRARELRPARALLYCDRSKYHRPGFLAFMLV